MDRGAASNTAPASCLQGLQSKEDLAPTPGNIPSKHLSITIFRWWYLAWTTLHRTTVLRRGARSLTMAGSPLVSLTSSQEPPVGTLTGYDHLFTMSAGGHLWCDRQHARPMLSSVRVVKLVFSMEKSALSSCFGILLCLKPDRLLAEILCDIHFVFEIHSNHEIKVNSNIYKYNKEHYAQNSKPVPRSTTW